MLNYQQPEEEVYSIILGKGVNRATSTDLQHETKWLTADIQKIAQQLVEADRIRIIEKKTKGWSAIVHYASARF